MVRLAQFGLVAWMADGCSQLGSTMSKLTLVSVATVAVLAVRATQLRLVASSVDYRVNGSRRVVLPTKGDSRRSIGTG